MKVSEAIEKLRSMNSKKKSKYLACIIIAAVIFVIYFSTFAPVPDEVKTEDIEDVQDLEKRLEKALSNMEGVGKVSVVINYESSKELVPAVSTDVKSTSSQDGEKSVNEANESAEVVSVNGSALILRENQPDVRGVIVVAEGAEDIGIRMNLLYAVTTLLDITSDKVEILY